MEIPPDILEKRKPFKLPVHLDLYYCEITSQQAEQIKADDGSFPDFRFIEKQYDPPAHGFMSGFAQDYSPFGIGVWGDALCFGDRLIEAHSILAVQLQVARDLLKTVGQVVWTKPAPAEALNAGICLFDLAGPAWKTLKNHFFEQKVAHQKVFNPFQ